MSTWYVGQEVMISGGYGRDTGPKPGVVTKVARKYVTAECVDGWANPAQFHIDTGWEKSDFSTKRRIQTPETILAEQRRAAAFAAMKELGFVPEGWSNKVTLSTEQIEAMVEAAS